MATATAIGLPLMDEASGQGTGVGRFDVIGGPLQQVTAESTQALRQIVFEVGGGLGRAVLSQKGGEELTEGGSVVGEEAGQFRVLLSKRAGEEQRAQGRVVHDGVLPGCFEVVLTLKVLPEDVVR